MQKLILNSTQIPNYLLDEAMPNLTDTEFRVVMIIARQTYGWHKESDQISYSQLVKKTGRYKEAIAKSLKSLREKGIIQVTDQKGKVLLSKEECIGKILYYRIKTTSSKYEPHLFDFRSSISEHTKETYTKVLSKDNRGVVKKQPSCPLLNGSPLKEKYPGGHTECVEYYLSVEKRRGNKFINQPKQFHCLHKILKAGYGFDEMNKTFPKIEKKYGWGNWDFGTLTNWLEKGVLNG